MAGDIDQGESGGLSRRQLIKASAVAGAAAWTAPMIIDSLASPAAAVSGVSTIGCSWVYVFFNKPGSTEVFYSAFQGTSTCGSFASNNTADVCGPCDSVNYSIAQFTGGESGSVGNLRYGGTCPRDGGVSDGSTAATKVGSADCGTWLSVNGNVISPVGGATILAGFGKKGQDITQFCGDGFDVGSVCGTP